MHTILEADLPIRPVEPSEDSSPMSRHAAPEITGPLFETSVSLLAFTEDGTPAGVYAEATVTRIHAEITAELDVLGITFTPRPWPGPASKSCGFEWEADYGLTWCCTGGQDHRAGHKAHDTHGDVIATHPLELEGAAA